MDGLSNLHYPIVFDLGEDPCRPGGPINQPDLAVRLGHGWGSQVKVRSELKWFGHTCWPDETVRFHPR